MHPTRSTAAARRSTLALALFAAAGVGCSSQHNPASMGRLAPAPITQTPATLSLGAGDALGQIVYINDVILALGGKPSEFWAMNKGSMPSPAGLHASPEVIASLPILPRPNLLEVDPFNPHAAPADAPIANVIESLPPGE